MIVYRVVRWAGTRPKTVKMRRSDKNKRVYAKLRKYRKMWWHFKTRWDPNPDELIEE